MQIKKVLNLLSTFSDGSKGDDKNSELIIKIKSKLNNVNEKYGNETWFIQSKQASASPID